MGWGEEEGRGVRDRAGGEGLGHKVGWGCGDAFCLILYVFRIDMLVFFYD